MTVTGRLVGRGLGMEDRANELVAAVNREFSEVVVDPNQIPALGAERFDLIDTDLILWDNTREDLEGSGTLEVPTFRNLDAVREGRMVVLGPDLTAAQSFRTVLNTPWTLERLEPQIAAAMDGDPETEVEETTS